MSSEIKLDFAIVSTVISLASYYPYIRDMLQGKTKPHAYTWLIWVLTQSTAVAGIIYGGGNYGAISLAINLIMLAVVFILSFKYGTTDISRSDTIVLVVALCAIVVW